MAQFTRDNAAIMQARAQEARKAKLITAISAAQSDAQSACNSTAIPDNFVPDRLMRVRKQLLLIDRMIANETDPAKLDRLASASAKLSVVEQNLAGRPGPGQYKPTAPPKHQHSQDVEPG